MASAKQEITRMISQLYASTLEACENEENENFVEMFSDAHIHEEFEYAGKTVDDYIKFIMTIWSEMGIQHNEYNITLTARPAYGARVQITIRCEWIGDERENDENDNENGENDYQRWKRENPLSDDDDPSPTSQD